MEPSESNHLDQADMEHIESVADRLAELYVNHRDRFVVMRPDGSTYIPKVGSRTMVLAKSNLVKHVACEYAVSIYAGKEGSKFICFDVDQGGRERTEQVMDALVQFGVPWDMIHVSFSGGKGHHVEVFFDDAVRTRHLLRLYKHVMQAISATSQQIEFRPLHKMAIKLPLSRHHRTGNRCWFLDQDTFEPIEDVDYLFSVVPMRAEELLTLIEQIPVEVELPPKVYQSITESDLDVTQFNIDRIFAPLTQPGTRHQHMVRIAVYLRHCGANAVDCNEALTHWYRQQSDVFIKSTEQEVIREIRGIVKWVQSRNFHVVDVQSGSVYFSLRDMQRVMEHTRRSDRQIHFFLLILIKTWRALSYDQIAETTGIGRLTVAEAIKRLAASDDIVIKHGRIIRHPDGNMRRKKNCYAATEIAKIVNEHTEWQSDRLYTLVDIKAAHQQFRKTYYLAVHDMFSGCDLRRLLLPREYREYQENTEEV